MALLDLDSGWGGQGLILSPAEQAAYGALYREADPTGSGFVAAQPGAEVLRRSGLSKPALQKIWQIVDTSCTGRLTIGQFFTALRLCAIAQSGGDITNKANAYCSDPPVAKISPPSGCSQIKSTVAPVLTPTPLSPLGSMSGNVRENEILPADKIAYQQLFKSLNPVNGFVSGPAVEKHFLKSGLPAQKLAVIWQQADTGKDGKLDSNEFAVAMHLIDKATKGPGSGSGGVTSAPTLGNAFAAGPLNTPINSTALLYQTMLPKTGLGPATTENITGDWSTADPSLLIKQKETALSALVAEVDSLERRAQDVNRQVRELQSSREEKAAAVTVLESKVKETREVLFALKKQHSSDSANLNSLQERLRQRGAQQRALAEEEKRHQREQEAARTNQVQLTQKIEASNKSLEALANEMRALQTQVLDVQRQIRVEDTSGGSADLGKLGENSLAVTSEAPAGSFPSQPSPLLSTQLQNATAMSGTQQALNRNRNTIYGGGSYGVLNATLGSGSRNPFGSYL